jgi:hypothetical protein
VTCLTDLEGGGGVQGGRGSPEHGVPRRCKPSSGERRWWSTGAAEGTDKGVEGARGVGAELGAVRGVSTIVARQCSGGKGVEEEKGSSPGGCSFYSRWRQLAKES